MPHLTSRLTARALLGLVLVCSAVLPTTSGAAAEGAAADGAFGAYEGLYPTPGGLVAVGWAIDPAERGGRARYTETSQTVYPWGPGLTDTREPRVAEVQRPDVGAAYPAYGPAHGFRTQPGLTGVPVRTTLCIRVGASLDLGCRTASYQQEPTGAVDTAVPVAGGVLLRGWALDLNSYGPVDVHVHVDGRPVAAVTADRSRPDVGAAYPGSPAGTVPGYGDAHGYEVTLPLPAGPRTVCTYAIDVDDYPGLGSNSLLGCRTVVVPSADPVGRLDGATPAPGGFTLRGWAADPDAPTTPLQVHTYRDGTGAAITTADRPRPDLLALDGGRYGSAHGFELAVATGARSRVCSYAINTGAGSGNTTLACLDLVRPVAPTGTLDEVTRTSPTQVSVRGWALDPDTADALDVHVYVDGSPAAVATADGARGDVAAASPGWGPGHGYSVAVAAKPGQRVCSYAINTLQGTSNTTLGCRTA